MIKVCPTVLKQRAALAVSEDSAVEALAPARTRRGVALCFGLSTLAAERWMNPEPTGVAQRRDCSAQRKVCSARISTAAKETSSRQGLGISIGC